jgi:hypothetical protein
MNAGSKTKVILENTGMAVKGRSDIGRWEHQWHHGKSQFRGKPLYSKEWSPWMKKRELRDWFAKNAEPSTCPLKPLPAS